MQKTVTTDRKTITIDKETAKQLQEWLELNEPIPDTGLDEVVKIFTADFGKGIEADIFDVDDMKEKGIPDKTINKMWNSMVDECQEDPRYGYVY